MRSTASDQWQEAFAAAGAGAWQWDLQSGRVKWSSALEALHGLPAGAFPGTVEARDAFVHPEDRSRVVTRLGEGAPIVEYRILRLDGGVRWVESRNRLLLDEQGKPASLLGLCFDVTATARRLEATRERTERLAKLAREGFGVLAQHSPEALLMRCGDVIHFANDTLARMLGWHEGSALVGMSLLELVAPDERGLFAWQMSGADAGVEPPPAQLRLLRRDGTTLVAELRQGPPSEFEGVRAHVVSVREAAAERGSVRLAADTERLEDRVVAVREMLDRAIVGAAHDSSSELTRSRLQELSSRLGELWLAAAQLRARTR